MGVGLNKEMGIIIHFTEQLVVLLDPLCWRITLNSVLFEKYWMITLNIQALFLLLCEQMYQIHVFKHIGVES